LFQTQGPAAYKLDNKIGFFNMPNGSLVFIYIADIINDVTQFDMTVN